MSFPEFGLVLTGRARKDFVNILRYTRGKWGDNQHDIYRAIINKAILTVRHNPPIGREQESNLKKYRVFPAGEHVIFYRVQNNTIYVHRILHKRMDKKRHV